jgi:hypothetical protein
MFPESSTSQPADFIRVFRHNYVNLYRRWNQTKSIPEGTSLHTPREEPIREEDLPDGLRTKLQAFRGIFPNKKIELLKYMRLVNGKPVVVIEDESDLPEEEHLLVLSQTLTLNTNDTVDITTDILVARRE